MRLIYTLTDPLDAEATESLPDAESWYIGVELDGAQVGRLAVHRVPLHNQRDLGWETDAGDDIPGHPVAAVTDFDSPRADVLRRVNDPDQALGESFLVVENVELDPDWQGLQLEPLLLSVVLEKLLTGDDAFAVAEPVPQHVKGKPRAEAAARHNPVFSRLGFTPYRLGVWLLTDRRSLWLARDALCRRFAIRQPAD